VGKTTSMMSLREKARAFLNPKEEKDKRETLDLTTFEHEHEHDYTEDRERGSKRQSGGKMVQWSQSTTTIQPLTTAAAGRPGTPGAISTLSMSTNTATAVPVPITKKKGLFRSFWGKKDEA
jgi:hypothetical protein